LERFVSYDIKGIQKSIFSTPRLLTIVGGSALVDEFDQNVKTSFLEEAGVELIFSGGGKGTFKVDSLQRANTLTKQLIDEAHSKGVSLRIANEDSFDKATSGANQLFPFIPEELEGHPCRESALYPVKNGGVHHLIKERIELGKKDPVGTKVINEMKKHRILPEKLHDVNIRFFNSIDEDGSSGGMAGDALFNKRKRWAVIAMDGNDIGMQFRQYNNIELVKEASKAISDTTLKAFAYALSDSIEEYGKMTKQSLPVQKENGIDYKVLPFRPLILGGDDLLLIAHTSVALFFVRRMVHYFEEFSAEANRNSTNTLWSNSDNLTISAGVVYIGTKYPLYSAVQYADELLSGAKAEFRIKNSSTPSAVDWENITEGFIDTPAERRYRELVFIDEALDNKRIELTCRPYSIKDLEEKLMKGIISHPKARTISRSVAVGLFDVLNASWAKRVSGLSGLIRHEKKWLFEYLDESNLVRPGAGWIDDKDNNVRKTMILDALSIMEEEHRIKIEVEK